MVPCKLPNGMALIFEPADKKIRLAIIDGGNVLACRKELVSNLRKFNSCIQGQLFKGRLQLYKSDNLITIILKGIPVGDISTDVFARACN